MGLMVMNKGIVKHLNGLTPREFIMQKEFSQMVDNIRLAEKSLGSGKLKISKSSKKNLKDKLEIEF
mgnify:CR=1 FL=1